MPESSYIRYLGRFSIEWRVTLASDLEGVDWDAVVQEECARLDKEEAAHETKLAALNQQYGLTLGPVDPAPIEPSHTAPALPSEPEPSAPQECQTEQPSELGSDVAPS